MNHNKENIYKSFFKAKRVLVTSACVSIGRYAFIGAGAVVTKDVPDHALVLGNPAKFVGWVCECSHRPNSRESIDSCPECGKGYSQTNGGLRLFDHINLRHDNPLLNFRNIHVFT